MRKAGVVVAFDDTEWEARHQDHEREPEASSDVRRRYRGISTAEETLVALLSDPSTGRIRFAGAANANANRTEGRLSDRVQPD